MNIVDHNDYNSINDRESLICFTLAIRTISRVSFHIFRVWINILIYCLELKELPINISDYSYTCHWMDVPVYKPALKNNRSQQKLLIMEEFGKDIPSNQHKISCNICILLHWGKAWQYTKGPNVPKEKDNITNLWMLEIGVKAGNTQQDRLHLWEGKRSQRFRLETLCQNGKINNLLFVILFAPAEQLSSVGRVKPWSSNFFPFPI